MGKAAAEVTGKVVLFLRNRDFLIQLRSNWATFTPIPLLRSLPFAAKLAAHLPSPTMRLHALLTAILLLMSILRSSPAPSRAPSARMPARSAGLAQG